VVGLLGAALLLTGLLLTPRLLPASGRTTSARFTAGGEAMTQTETAAPAPDAAAEPPPPPEPAEPELPPFGDKNLPREASIRGRVLDGEGKPVADAVVAASYRDWRERTLGLVSCGRVRTEADGFFVIGPLERQAYALLAQKEGVGVSYSANHQPGAWVELVLTPGARLSGTVTERDGRAPVANARVVVHEHTFRAETTTDAEGAYVLASVPPPVNAWAGYSVVAVADEFRRAERSSFVPKGGKEYRIDFALEKGATLTGKVFDRTQRPLAGATVGEGWEPFHRTVKTGADGSYSLPNVDTSPNLLFVARADGYLPQQRQSDGTGALDFELDASLAVEGIVVDRADKPAAGARVYLHRVSFAPGFQPDTSNQASNFATSGEDGRFRFDEVLPGQVAVIAFHREHGPGEQHPVDVPVGGPGPRDVRVRLREGLTIEGEVRGRDDQPLASVSVQVYGWEAVPGYNFVPQYRWQENPIAFTDEQGRFRIQGALPGQQWLNAYHMSYGWAGQQVSGVDGQRVSDVRISFAGGLIEGRVVTASGEPVPRAWVNARGPKNTPRMTQRYVETDGVGRFRLGGLPDGSYDLQANLNSGTAEPVLDVPTGRTDVEIVLKPTHTLLGDVRSTVTGRAIERFYLSIMPQQPEGGRRSRRGPQGTQWANWVQTPDGRFEQPVVPGSYQLVLKAPGHGPKVLDNVVVEELVPPAPLDILLDAGGGIEGTLRDTEGAPIPNVHVHARVFRGGAMQQSDWMLGGNDQTDSRGRFFLEGLGAGTYIVQCNLRQRGAASARVTVTGAGMVQEDLRLVPTGAVTCRAVDEEGKPVANVYFQFMDDDGNWIGWAGMTNEEGVSRADALRAGPATVKAIHQAQEYVADDVRIEVLSSRTITLDITLRKKE
jgi:protocatechuate 3,4-dioxygenase beta subunit